MKRQLFARRWATWCAALALAGAAFLGDRAEADDKGVRAAGVQSPDRPPSPKRAATAASGDLPGGNAWLEDPFGNLGVDMSAAVGDLEAGQTRPPVQTTHPRLEQRLQELIAMLEESCKKSGGGGQNPSQPANASTLRTGADRQGPLQDPGQSQREWAKLTPKQREKILQTKNAGLPAEYEDVLTDYFLRLSRAKAPADDQ